MPLSRTFINVNKSLSYATYFSANGPLKAPGRIRTFRSSSSKTILCRDSPCRIAAGPVASGTPVQLLFWGDWWNSDEAGPRLNL